MESEEVEKFYTKCVDMCLKLIEEGQRFQEHGSQYYSKSLRYKFVEEVVLSLVIEMEANFK